MTEKKRISEEELKQIAAGTDPGLFDVLRGFGNALELLNQAYEANACPICGAKINPNGDACTANEALAHIALTHGKEDE